MLMFFMRKEHGDMLLGRPYFGKRLLVHLDSISVMLFKKNFMTKMSHSILQSQPVFNQFV